jgi:glycosyltransferase involved in cell wall biosynthesis
MEKQRALSRATPWHIITSEYPPQSGGVSDYTYLVAKGLASSGDEVHVWCPANAGKAPELPGVQVHPEFCGFTPSDLRRVGRELQRFPTPRRLLVQWVPHGFGYKSLNLGFCLWLWRRSLQGDHLELMVHEPSLPFTKTSWRQNAAAVVHRLMTVILLRSARDIFVSTPAWENRLRPWAMGRRHSYRWLPLPSNVPVVENEAGIGAIRAKYCGDGPLIGHFGTFGGAITPMLRSIIPALVRKARGASVLLIGPGSEVFQESVLRECPDLKMALHALGQVGARDPRLSLTLSACDLVIQPYPDGVTSRRTTIMAALAHGRPAITTAGVLTEPFWQTSGAVALAPAEDSEAFADLALRLMEDGSARRVLGETGRRFYQREFDIDHVVAMLRERGPQTDARPREQTALSK